MQNVQTQAPRSRFLDRRYDYIRVESHYQIRDLREPSNAPPVAYSHNPVHAAKIVEALNAQTASS